MAKKIYIMTIRVDKHDYDDITELAEALGISKSEVWRRLLATVRILYSDYITLREALSQDVEKVLDKPLSSALKSLPELAEVVKTKLSPNFVRGRKAYRRT